MGRLKRLSSRLTGKREALPDQEVVDMIRSGGAARQRAITWLHDEYLKGFIIDMCNKHSVLVEEEVIDAYANAIVAVDRMIFEERYRGGAKISTLLYGILNRRCIDQVRKKIGRNTSRPAAAEEPDETDGQPSSDPADDESAFSEGYLLSEKAADDEQYASEAPVAYELDIPDNTLNPEAMFINKNLARTAMERLSPRCKAILIDKEEGYSPQEIARRNGLKNARTASQTCTNCKKQLIDILNTLNEPNR